MIFTQHLSKNTPDLTGEQIETLATLFSECVNEGRFDFDRLRATLGDLDALADAEAYTFTWAARQKSFAAYYETTLLSEGTDRNLRCDIPVNTPENAKLTFTEVINDVMQAMLDVNFKFYKLYAEELHFAELLRGRAVRSVFVGAGAER